MPESHSQNTPAHDPSQPWPGIGRVEIPIPPELFEVDDEVVMDDDTPDPLGDVLHDAERVRLHLGAMLEILRSVHPAYKIEAGLYLGNLQGIHDKLVRLIEGLCLLADAQAAGAPG